MIWVLAILVWIVLYIPRFLFYGLLMFAVGMGWRVFYRRLQ